MELLSFASPAAALSRSSSYPFAVLTTISVRRMRTIRRLNFRSPKRRLRVLMPSSKNDSAPLISGGVGELPSGDGFVEVIGIGSRKDAVIDFCLDSPFQLASSVRFWNVHMKDAQNMQLQEKCLTKDLSTRIVDAEQFLQLSSKAVILVASAGYGLDHVIATDILKTIGSRNGFAVAIFLKPFSFEGQRRQDEMKDLGQKVQEHTKFCIDIDTDKLLKKDSVTLDEALKTANSTVLLAINAISVLISGIHRKLFDVAHNHVKDLEVSEVMKILEQYKEAKIGFGAGGTIKSSILQALYDCPFIGSSLEQDFSGIVICIIASSGIVDRDANSLHSFRQVAKYTGEIIMSTTYEPNLEPNAVVITVLAVGSTVEVSPQSRGLLSIFAQHFPFVFNLFGKQYQQSSENERNNLLKGAELSKVISSPQYGPTEDQIAMEGVTGTVHEHPEDLTTVSSGNYDDIYGSRNCVVGAEETEASSLEDISETPDFYNQSSAGTPAFQRESLSSWNLGPGFQIAQEWAKERAGTTSVMDNFGIFCLPVGVKSPEELKDNHMSVSHTGKLPETKANLNSSSWDTLTDAGLEAVKDLYTSASLLLKGKNLEVPKKQGVLSVRAASMLEAERDSPKKWSPVVEMQYRGGVYRGRCQGGLPEGKGRLVLGDGSIYDGMWRNGKRYGTGAFYFSNGDVFQGLWRDDMMHGKGWFYFHTGDRWFANFWKGKANGESRFYSKSGDVFFGHFQDGWRHGQFLCIGVDGARCMETWEEGILVCRKHLGSDTDAENVSSTALT